MIWNKIKFGIAPINWSNDDLLELGADITLEQCLGDMQKAGFSGTEMGHKYPTDAQRLKPILGRYNLDLASAWFSTYFVQSTNPEEELDRLEKSLQFLSAMGANTVNLAECSGAVHNARHIPLLQKPVFDEKDWDRLIRGLSKAGQLCHTYGIQAGYHHHMGTGIESYEEIERLMKSTDPETISLCADTGHLCYAGIDPLDVFKNFSDRIKHIHLKDVRRNILESGPGNKGSFLDSVLEGVFTVPGDGMIDFVPIFEAVVDSEYEGWMIVEAEQNPAKADPLQYAQMAAEYLGNIFAS